ncbi:MAG TPA: ABC transporter ATP-binding protein [Steroidobacteraceae bacterium]|nr:ABC transporter ATP-binding protein [Steroidobacteraceae bacterium]
MVLSEPLIEMRNAAFAYGARAVFSGLDLDVNQGELLSILGPNGCGKSTLLRCLGGALSLNEGSVRLGKTELSSLPPNIRARRVGFLFQQHTPSFPFRVFDVVSMGRAPYLGLFDVPSAADATLIAEALERVGMLHARERPYTELSGGERQLVLLARTLVQQPEVILLDEPTSHLDFRNQVVSLRMISALVQQGITMVMTTHDPNHALLFPGRVALMKPGGTLLTGPAAEIITDATLTATYGIDIATFAVPRHSGSGDLRLCSPW